MSELAQLIAKVLRRWNVEHLDLDKVAMEVAEAIRSTTRRTPSAEQQEPVGVVQKQTLIDLAQIREAKIYPVGTTGLFQPITLYTHQQPGEPMAPDKDGIVHIPHGTYLGSQQQPQAAVPDGWQAVIAKHRATYKPKSVADDVLFELEQDLKKLAAAPAQPTRAAVPEGSLSGRVVEVLRKQRVLDDAFSWADGILGDVGTEFASRITEDELMAATALMQFCKDMQRRFGKKIAAAPAQPTRAAVPYGWHNECIGFTRLHPGKNALGQWIELYQQPRSTMPDECTDINHHERYRAGWNACREAMLAAAPAQPGEGE